jgi:hypothetical protein
LQNIHLDGQKGKGRMMLRLILGRVYAWKGSGAAKDSIPRWALVLVLLSLKCWLQLPIHKMCCDSGIYLKLHSDFKD